MIFLDALGLIIFNYLSNTSSTLPILPSQGKPRRPIHPASPPSPSPTVPPQLLLPRLHNSRIPPPHPIQTPMLSLHHLPNRLLLQPPMTTPTITLSDLSSTLFSSTRTNPYLSLPPLSSHTILHRRSVLRLGTCPMFPKTSIPRQQASLG
jgi:hypothetical protein